jgi:hypothetical protein
MEGYKMAYEFTQDSFREFSEAVISAGGDQATLTTLLSQMQDVIIDNIGKMEQLTQSNENVTKENERLKSANMDLFLRIGSQAEGIENKSKETPKDDPVGVDDFLKNLYKEDNNNGN